MTQFQFDAIIKIIQSGAPALADELCSSLNNLVNDYNKVLKELNDLLEKQEESSCDCERTNEQTA